MICRYKYPEGHVRAGEQCSSWYACNNKDRADYGYCFGHAIHMGLISEERIGEINAKKSEGQRLRHERRLEDEARLARIEKEKEISRLEDKLRAENDSLKSKKMDDDTPEKRSMILYHRIINDENFDAEVMFRDFNYAMRSSDSALQGLLAMWWMADPETRSPQSLRRFAKLIEKPLYLVHRWLTDDWFERKLDRERYKRMKLLSPFIDKIAAVKALRGDKGSVSEFYKQIGVIDLKGDRGKGELMDKLDPDMLNEAREETGLDKKEGLRLKPGEKNLEIQLIDSFTDLGLSDRVRFLNDANTSEEKDISEKD